MPVTARQASAWALSKSQRVDGPALPPSPPGVEGEFSGAQLRNGETRRNSHLALHAGIRPPSANSGWRAAIPEHGREQPSAQFRNRAVRTGPKTGPPLDQLRAFLVERVVQQSQ
jgi:hypothetical protein